jgi:hypothetical protein
MTHYILYGADFGGAVDQYGHPVAFSAAEIIFNNIASSAYINIMNPNNDNISFALESNRSTWDAASLTAMVRGLGADVGADHVNCSLCTVEEVPYVWGVGGSAPADDYIPIVSGDIIMAGSKYFITASGTYTLPAATGILASGSSVTFTKLVDALPPGVFININAAPDIISTGLGTSDSIEMDVPDDLIFVFDGIHTWHLQIGTVV